MVARFSDCFNRTKTSVNNSCAIKRQDTMKGLTLIALFLILLSAQSACGEEELRVKNVEVCKIIPLNIEYPLFEYGSCENLTFDDVPIGSVFEFNSTSKNTTIEHLRNDDRVNVTYCGDGSIQFELTNHPNYSIFLLSDILVIKHTIRSDEWLNYSEYWSKKNNDVSDVVKENFFNNSPILPDLDGVRPWGKNEWYSTFTVIIVDPDYTKPRINDTNLESYARFLLHAPNESIKIERTGAGKFVAYHKGKEVALIRHSHVHPERVWDFVPFIELTEIIIPISEERIKIVESGIDDSSVIMGRNLADLIRGKSFKIPEQSPADDYRKDIKNLTDLKKKEQEALLNSNMNILVDIFEEFGRGRSMDYWEGSLTDDINELNRKLDRLDNKYYSALQIRMVWYGVIVAIFVAVVAVCYNHKQLKYAKGSAKKQTEQLSIIKKLLIKFHKITISHKKK